jgi:hypothetical protein
MKGIFLAGVLLAAAQSSFCAQGTCAGCDKKCECKSEKECRDNNCCKDNPDCCAGCAADPVAAGDAPVDGAGDIADFLADLGD